MKKIFLLLVGCSAFCLHAQKYELGNVKKEELAEKRHPTDTAAVAAMLFKKAKTVFLYTEADGFSSSTDFTVKIKVYKKEGAKWANFEIPVFTGYENIENDVLTITQAHTYNLENDKIEKTKVTSESKFVAQYNENWKLKSVAFPNVSSGSIIELKYNVKSQNISILPDFQYQYDIPVNYAEYVSEIPEYYIYKTMQTGFVPLSRKDKMEAGSQNYDYKADHGKVSHTMTYQQIETTFKAENIPALVKESYVDNINNYYAKIEQELQLIRYPNKDPKQIAETWESVAKTIYKEKSFGGELQKYSFFMNELEKAIGDQPSDSLKVAKVFRLVKDRMSWNGRNGYYTIKGIEKAFDEKTGNAAEINLLLVAMLRMSGLDANPVLLSTRDNGLALFPNTTKFNYVIAQVNAGGTDYLLDATSKNALPNVLPIRDLNGLGRIIKADGSATEVNLMPKNLSRHVVSMLGNLSKEGVLSGKIREQFFDYQAFQFAEHAAKLSNDSQIARIEQAYKNLEVSDYSVEPGILGKPTAENYSFNHADHVEVIGDKMFFQPMFFFATESNPLKTDNRHYPVNYAFPFQNRYNISLTIPEGYSVESIPQPKSVAMPDGLGNFRYNVTADKNKIQLFFTFDINRAEIPADYYDVLKNFYKEMIQKQTEKVILKKA